MNAEQIIKEALAISDYEKRLAFLSKACEGSPQLFLQVEAITGRTDDYASTLDGLPPPAKSRLADSDLETKPYAPELNDVMRQVTDLFEPSVRPGSLGRLAHYDIEKVLGQGGFGVVLKAFDEKLRREVAIKVLAPSLAATSPPRKRFLREARAVAAVHHKNIVQIYAVEEEPSPYLVMEYVEGKSLQERCDQDGPFAAAEVVRLGAEIACGLAAAHAKGIVHRDVKPANILLTTGSTPHAKLSDFGLARTADDASVTRSGAIIGTPMFMAPEQVTGGEIDHRADLFSLGSVLYTMCSGRPPFRASSMYGVLKRVTEDKPRSIRQVIPEVPVGLSSVIERLHQKDPAKRFQSATEALVAIEASLGNPSPRVLPTSSDHRVRLGVATAIAAIVILVASATMPSVISKRKSLDTNLLVGTTATGETLRDVATETASLPQTDDAPRDPEELKQFVRKQLLELNPEINPAGLTFKIANGRIAELHIQPMLLVDLSPLAKLSDLEKLQLYLDHGRPVDLGPLRTMHKLKHFVARNIHIEDLSPLSELPLEVLDIWGWGGKDLSPLQGLPLHLLNCGASSVRDISPLQGMPLEYLCINYTQVSDLSPLRGIPLRELLVESTPVRNLQPLRGQSLTLLAILHTEVHDFSLISEFPLKKLFIDNPEQHLDLIDRLPLLQIVNGKSLEEFKKSVNQQ